jgi:4-amino-4-deoxy-L-arabinose transferase-like glycosyltransferase
VAWALVTPPFLVPDEAEHVSYVQSLVENGERAPETNYFPAFSSELRGFIYYSQNTRALADTRLKPAWSPAAERAWERDFADVRRHDIENVGPQANHPPLYYAYETVAYAATSGADLRTRLAVMRLWSSLLLLVTTAAAWLLVGELTRGDRVLQLAGAACVGLQPMSGFVSAGVNPDALLFAAYAVALWLAVRLLVREPSRAAVAGLVGATAVAVFTKPAGLALVPASALVLVLLARRRGGRAARLAIGVALAAPLLIAAGILAAPGLTERTPLELDPTTLRGFGTYLWDFYLPRLPFQTEYAALALDNPAWTVWVEYSWGSFGFLEARFPRALYVLLVGVSVTVLVAAAVAVVRRRFQVGRAVGAVLALVFAALVLGLHWADFQKVQEPFSHRIIQGRYLLPLMPLVAVAVAAALSNLGHRRAHGAAVVIAGAAALQLASLALVAGRYLA